MYLLQICGPDKKTCPLPSSSIRHTASMRYLHAKRSLWCYGAVVFHDDDGASLIESGVDDRKRKEEKRASAEEEG